MSRAIHRCEGAVGRAGTDRETQERQRKGVLSKWKEAQRRWYVGALWQATDGPSARAVSRITGVDGQTIGRGRRELGNGATERLGERQRPLGGGRPKAEKKRRA